MGSKFQPCSCAWCGLGTAVLLSWYWSEFYPCPLGTALPINELHALCINQHWCCTSVVDVARILIR